MTTSRTWYDIFTKGGGGPDVLTLDGVNGALTIASIANPSVPTLNLVGGTALTTSQPVLNMAQGWAAGLASPTAIKLNVTDGGATGTPLLLDLQVGGSTKFRVNNKGGIKVSAQGSSSFANLDILGGTGNSGMYFYNNEVGIILSDGASGFGFSSGSLRIHNVPITNNGGALGFSLGNGAPLTYLTIDADGILAQRYTTNAQTLRIYKTYTDASNYAAASLSASNSLINLEWKQAGTGAGAFGIRLTSSVGNYLEVDASGNAYASTSVGVASKLLIMSPSDGVATLFNWNANNFDRLQFGGTTSSFPALKRSAAALQCRLADDSAYAALSSASLTLSGGGYTANFSPSGGSVGGQAYFLDNYGSVALELWASGNVNRVTIPTTGCLDWNNDTDLYRDASHILALRHDADAMTMRVYNTFTDALNYERGSIGWSSGEFIIQTQKAGTGTNAALVLNVPSGRLILFRVDGGEIGRCSAQGVTLKQSLSISPASRTLSNGLNSNVSLTDNSYLIISGPTGAFSVGGFSAATYNGQTLQIFNSTAQTMTIVNEDASSTVANRIKTLTGADVVLRAGTSSATFIYDDTVNGRWILMSTN